MDGEEGCRSWIRCDPTFLFIFFLRKKNKRGKCDIREGKAKKELFIFHSSIYILLDCENAKKIQKKEIRL